MLLEPQPPSASTSPLPDRAGFQELQRTVRPIAYTLAGLAVDRERLLALDSFRGYLLEVDPLTDNTVVLNRNNATDWLDGVGLSVAGDTVWFAQGNDVYWCKLDDWVPQLFVTLSYPADGVAVWQSTVYIACQKSGYILIYDRKTHQEITRFHAPGVGTENLAVREEELWVCDRIEQTVYCMDRATGEVRFSILTPFQQPVGLAFYPIADGEELVYVAYTFEEPYIRDNPNAEVTHELTFRDRTFIHPLHFRYFPEGHYTLSNGYLLEMTYVEELSPLEEVEVKNLEWKIALPPNTPRQTIRQVEPIGMPFKEEMRDGQRVAVFKFDTLHPHQSCIFGWKVLMEVRGIKYQFTYEDVDRLPPLPLEYQSSYLIDDDELAMDQPVIQQAARESIGTETNLLRKVLKIRNYVYDRLSYSIRPHIDTPDVVINRGTGSCGEYVGLLLALMRLNGIACRTVGRYKCPPFADHQNVPLEPDFNHVWIEFFIPGRGWIPMESNVDDIIDGGPYPTRFFMGLPWYHAEMAKGIPFEKLDTPDDSIEVSIGELAINHIRFKILGELPPL